MIKRTKMQIENKNEVFNGENLWITPEIKQLILLRKTNISGKVFLRAICKSYHKKYHDEKYNKESWCDCRGKLGHMGSEIAMT